MLDRVFAAIVALMIGALLVQCLCGLACVAMRELGSLLRGPGIGLLLVVLLVGAAAQLVGRLRGGDRRLTRERRAEDRFVRQSVRRPAADVPLQERAARPDRDPAINEEREEVPEEDEE